MLDSELEELSCSTEYFSEIETEYSHQNRYEGIINNIIFIKAMFEFLSFNYNNSNYYD
jgi:hypothetical protein